MQLIHTAAGTRIQTVGRVFNPSSRLCLLPTVGVQPQKEIYRNKTCQRTDLQTNTNTPRPDRTAAWRQTETQLSSNVLQFVCLAKFSHEGSSVHKHTHISTAVSCQGYRVHVMCPLVLEQSLTILNISHIKHKSLDFLRAYMHAQALNFHSQVLLLTVKTTKAFYGSKTSGITSH